MSATNPFGEGTIGRAAAPGALGFRVVRQPALLPQTATGTIFRVNGGRVALYLLLGRFTVAANATATNLTVVNTVPVAANGATTGLTSATAITSQALGSSAALPAAVGGALILGTGAVAAPTNPLIVNPGTIDLTTSASNATAAMGWVVYYVPLDGGASVTAA